MALKVEDGSGVANADAYISLADADARHLSRLGVAWSGTDEEKEAAIRRATSFIDGLNFPGTPTGGRSQSLAWPRIGVHDRDGFQIESDELPEEVATATALLAFVELATPEILTPTIDRTAIRKRQKVGPIEIENAGNPGTESFNRVVVTAAMDLLKPLTIGGNTQFLARA